MLDRPPETLDEPVLLRRKPLAIPQPTERVNPPFEHKTGCPQSKPRVRRLVRVEIGPKAALEVCCFQGREESLRNERASYGVLKSLPVSP